MHLPWFTGRPDLAQVGLVRSRAADRITRGGADEQVEVRIRRLDRVVAGQAEFGTALPPAMLAHYNAGIEGLAETRSDAHPAFRCVDRQPVAVGNAAIGPQGAFARYASTRLASRPCKLAWSMATMGQAASS